VGRDDAMADPGGSGSSRRGEAVWRPTQPILANGRVEIAGEDRTGRSLVAAWRSSAAALPTFQDGSGHQRDGIEREALEQRHLLGGSQNVRPGV